MLKTTGELKQNGTPSSENPVEIENEIYIIKDGQKIKLERTDMIRLLEQELKVATEKEKTADELFEELGYEIKKSTTIHRYRLYNADDILAIHISFNLKTKRINIVCEKEALDMQELKAINKKVEELGLK